MSPKVLGEILDASVNTSNVNGKYSVQDCENLSLPI